MPVHPRAQIAQVSLPLPRVLSIASEYEQAGRYDDAEQLLHSVLAAVPQQPEAQHLMGLLAFHKGQLEKSARLIEQAIAQDSSSPLFFRNICTVYEGLGRYDEAIFAGRRAVELDPYDPNAYHNLAVTYYRLLQIDESIACARRAMALDPTLAAPHFALAESLLLRGEFASGWEEYEWRFQIPGAGKLMPKTDRPQWNGAPIRDGTLLLIADQGFGDTIQFSRYIPWARQRCPNNVLACDAEMQALMRYNHPGLPLFNRWERCPAFTAFCPLSGLPRLHGTTINTIPAAKSYIRPEPYRVSAWRRRLRQLLPANHWRIGIVWAGRSRPPNRSAKLETFAPIAALHDVALVALQLGEAQKEIAGYYHRAPLVNLGHEITDFMDTAAIIESLDAVITIDTAIAHLAGAMGKPVWIMLPYSPDWRWLLRRNDSPWYPTVHLCRQSTPRRWEPVVDRIAEQLRRYLTSTAPIESAPEPSPARRVRAVS